jgi:hypothetical protein
VLDLIEHRIKFDDAAAWLRRSGPSFSALPHIFCGDVLCDAESLRRREQSVARFKPCLPRFGRQASSASPI